MGGIPKKEKHIPSHGQFVAQRAGEETEWAGIPVDGPASRSRLQLCFHGMQFVYSVSMCLMLPSGKLTVRYGKSPSLIGKSAINGPCSIARGYCYQ